MASQYDVYKDLLREFLLRCEQESPALPKATLEQLECIVNYGFGILHPQRRMICAASVTLLLYKFKNPEQDIRKHQKKMEGGFNARSVDTAVASVLREEDLPAPTETAWISRESFRKEPFHMDYKGGITPPDLKKSFLCLLRDVSEGEVKAESCLLHLLRLAREKQRQSTELNLLQPNFNSIEEIIERLKKYWDTSGASKLPVIALYVLYASIISEMKKYKGCHLKPLASHTSPDARAGALGDIEILGQDGQLFEAIEVKHETPITASMVRDCAKKIQRHKISTYYILSTQTTSPSEMQGIADIVMHTRKTNGCRVTINGVYETIKYHLRLLDDPKEFIGGYREMIKKDSEISDVIKRRWNNIFV